MKLDFDALYRSHYRRVLGLCLRMLGRAAEAEDAAQEVFVRAYRALDRYDPAQPFGAWVLGIATNYCIDRLRKRTSDARMFVDMDAEAAELATEAPATLDLLVTAERAEAVRAAIAALPDRYRLPLVLACYGESSYDEIAAALGITRNHVGVLLLRARHALREALANSGEVPGS